MYKRQVKDCLGTVSTVAALSLSRTVSALSALSRLCLVTVSAVGTLSALSALSRTVPALSALLRHCLGAVITACTVSTVSTAGRRQGMALSDRPAQSTLPQWQGEKFDAPAHKQTRGAKIRGLATFKDSVRRTPDRSTGSWGTHSACTLPPLHQQHQQPRQHCRRGRQLLHTSYSTQLAYRPSFLADCVGFQWRPL